MKNHILLLLTALSLCMAACKKDPIPPIPGPTATSALIFNNLTFNQNYAYFSTDGSMSKAVDSLTAKSISSKIDITFFYNHDYTEPGFLDPVTRSQVWYWNEYHNPWLSNAVETRYYVTNLTKVKFDSAKIEQGRIAKYFEDTTVIMAPHGIYPAGSCIGGRQTYSPNSVTLSMGITYGFKNTVTGKRGLLYIRKDQETFWPVPFFNTDTKVDIIREK